MASEINRSAQICKGCAAVEDMRQRAEALDDVPKAPPWEIVAAKLRAGTQSVDRAPDFSTVPSMEGPPDPQQLRAMKEAMKAAIARERQPWWRRMVARLRGAMRQDEGEQ